MTLGRVSPLRGGIDRVTYTLSKELESRGHKIYMISIWRGRDEDKKEANQFITPSLNILSPENQTYCREFFKNHNIQVIIDQANNIELYNLILSTKDDIPLIYVNHGDPYASIKSIGDNWYKEKTRIGSLRYYLNIPIFTLRQFYRYYTRKKLLKSKQSYIYNTTDAYVLLSERFIPKFKKLIRQKDASKLYALSNPVNYCISENDNNSDKKNIALYVGRTEVSPKRVDRIIKAWRIANTKDWKLIIIGDGDDRTNLENFCKRNNLSNIEFIGQTDPKPYYKEASILCFSSTHEGFGLVLTEAISHGVIPIAYDSYESIHDIVENDENGVLITPFSINRYAKGLDKLMHNSSYRKKLTHKYQRERLKEKFNITNIVNSWEIIFYNLINRKQL